MCTGGRLIADFVAGTDVRPGLPAELGQHLTATVSGLWVVWACKLARPAGDLFVPMTGGAGYPADATAVCRHRFQHDAPDPGCTCGFHALSSQLARDQIISRLQVRGLGRGVAAVSVALSGRVLAFEWAGGAVLWRAARQTVVRIVGPPLPDPAREDVGMRPYAEGVHRTRRDPGDPDGHAVVVSPVAPRDSGPIRLDLPASAPALPVCHDDAGWCAVAGTFEYATRYLFLSSGSRHDRTRDAPTGRVPAPALAS